jgi:hypothetical protein
MRSVRYSVPFLSGITAAAILTQLLTSCAEAAILPPGEELILPTDAAVEDVATSVPVDDKQCKPQTWCRVTLPQTPLAINGIWGSGADDVWMAGSPAVALHWDGKRLEAESFDTRHPLVGIWGSSKDDIWAFSTSTAIWHRGASQQAEPTDAGDAGDAGDIGADAGDAGKAPSSSWTRSAGVTGTSPGGWSTPITAMWGTSATDIWAVGASVVNGAIASPPVYHSTGWRGGDPSFEVSPTSATSPPQVERLAFQAVCGSPTTGVWTVGRDGKTRYSDGWTEGAASFCTLDSQTSRALFATWCNSGPAGDVWAAGEGGIIRHFTREDGGGYVVESVEAPTTATLRAISGAAADDIWAVGDGGTILHWDGRSWKRAEAPLDGATTRDLFAIWRGPTGDLWIAGHDVLLYRGDATLPGESL